MTNKANIDSIIKDFRVFVDTCSWMHESSEAFFMQYLGPALEQNNLKVIVPDKVIKEVSRFQADNNNSDRQSSARKAARILKHYREAGFLDVRGEDGDPFADNVFHYVFSKFRTRYNLALITQDVELAKEIKQLEDSKAIHSSKTVLVFKLRKNGDLAEWDFGFTPNKEAIPSTQQLKNKSVSLSPVQFRVFETPCRDKNIIIPTRNIPSEGDSVIADEIGTIKLTKILGCGGEGTTFATNTGHACKIYHKNRITELRMRKLILMVDKQINKKGICWPLSLVRNKNNDFVGYLMPAGRGKPMQTCMFIKPVLENNFPHWNRHHLVQLALTWLERVTVLHDSNVLIGDINPLNFLIESESQVYFVDTDSYQIENYPCPVGMANFTAPEIQGKDYSSFLRTNEHETFAVATQLFMILMPGKPPFSQQGGGDPIHNIKNGDFSYPLGSKTNKKTPEGPWRFIWSHFPYLMKKSFYDCFTQGIRPSAKEWVKIVGDYQYRLREGHLDPSGESAKIFPAKFKKVSKHAQEEYGAQGNNLIDFTCDFCGKIFQVNDNIASKIRSLPKKPCRDCFSALRAKNESGRMIVCNNCGVHFMFTNGEQEYFEKLSLDPPKKCPNCRQNKSTKSQHINKRQTQKQELSLWDTLKDIWEILSR